MRRKSGEVPDAFVHPELGPVAFAYGTRSYGLRHIAEKHPGMVEAVPAILRDGSIVGRAADRVYVQATGSPPPSAVIRLDGDGRKKTWLVTAFGDQQGQIARQGRTSNEPPASASSPIPDATGQDQDNAAPGSAQPNETRTPEEQALAFVSKPYEQQDAMTLPQLAGLARAMGFRPKGRDEAQYRARVYVPLSADAGV